MDFVFQHNNDIIPIEVKSYNNIKSRSLQKYAKTFASQIKLRVRFSMSNLRLDNAVLNLPLFMVDMAAKLIKLALKIL